MLQVITYSCEVDSIMDMSHGRDPVNASAGRLMRFLEVWIHCVFVFSSCGFLNNIDLKMFQFGVLGNAACVYVGEAYTLDHIVY